MTRELTDPTCSACGHPAKKHGAMGWWEMRDGVPCIDGQHCSSNEADVLRVAIVALVDGPSEGVREAREGYLWKEDADVVKEWHRAFVAESVWRTEALNNLCTLIQNRTEDAVRSEQAGGEAGAMSNAFDHVAMAAALLLEENGDLITPSQYLAVPLRGLKALGWTREAALRRLKERIYVAALPTGEPK